MNTTYILSNQNADVNPEVCWQATLMLAKRGKKKARNADIITPQTHQGFQCVCSCHVMGDRDGNNRGNLQRNRPDLVTKMKTNAL